MLGLILTFMVVAQQPPTQIVASAGGTHSNQALTLEWTLGEIAVATIQHQNFALSQGYHQPLLSVKPVAEAEIADNQGDKESNFTVYPNPVQSILEVAVKTVEFDGAYRLVLSNAQGKILDHFIFSDATSNMKIDMTPYQAGSFMLNIFDQQGIRSDAFQIIKAY